MHGYKMIGQICHTRRKIRGSDAWFIQPQDCKFKRSFKNFQALSHFFLSVQFSLRNRELCFIHKTTLLCCWEVCFQDDFVIASTFPALFKHPPQESSAFKAFENNFRIKHFPRPHEPCEGSQEAFIIHLPRQNTILPQSFINFIM